MSFTVEKVKRRSKKPARPEQELQRQLVAALKYMLTPATFFFETDPARACRDEAAPAFAADAVMAHQSSLRGQRRLGVPDLAFIHGGRAFYLELAAPKGYLTPLQRAAHVALRDAGARVEVARSLPEALAHLRSFGIPLRAVSLQSVFRRVA